MMCTYNDTDVQDKARFYYALITRSTDTKVQSVLKSNLKDVESMNQAITSLLPGSTDKLSLANIIKLDQQLFNWKRVSVSCYVNDDQRSLNITNQGQRSLNVTSQELVHDYMNTDATEPTKDSGVDQYAQRVSNLDVLLEIKCHIQLREESELERTHAVTIQIEPSQVYQPVHNKHIACLAKLESRDVYLKLRPRLPLSRAVHCNVTFSCDNKLTYTNSLPPFDVEFSHLMMKLPWQPSQGSQDHHLTFTALWDWVLNRKIDERGGIESVKIFNLKQQQFKDIQEETLSQFQFETSTEKCDSCFAIFLPPEYHFLMKCEPRCDDTVVVTMVTDLWTLLPYIDTFLETTFR